MIDATNGPVLEREVLLSRIQMPDQEAYLEFDWYPPVRHNDATFLAGVNSTYNTGDKSWYNTSIFNLGSYTVDMDQQPQLSDFNSFTAEQWARMEAAGAIFLPAVHNNGGEGHYWSSSSALNNTARRFYFNVNELFASNTEPIINTCSIRMVKQTP